jgi:predicted PurR-regulated permease PerM
LLAVLLILIGLIWLLVIAAPLLQAVTIAALLAYLLSPLVHFTVNRLKIRRTVAVLLVYLLFLLLVAGVPAGVGALALSRLNDWGLALQEAVTALQSWLAEPHVVLGLDLSPRLLLARLQGAAGSAISLIPGGSLDILSGVTTNLLWLLVVFVSLFYLLKDEPKIKPTLLGLTPEPYRPEIARLLDELNSVWKIFLRAQLLIFFVLAVLMALGGFGVIWLYGAGLLPFSTLGLIAMLVLVYALVQQVDNLWLRPMLFSHRLRLHPGLVFVGLIGALGLSGLLGAILVVPAMATAKVVGRYIYCKLTDQPPWPDEVPLSAQDREAQEIDLEPANPL